MISCTDIVQRKRKVSVLIDFTVEILEYPLACTEVTLSDTLIFVLRRFVNDINWLVKSF